MPILKIKLVDASGLAMPGQTVLVSNIGQLQSNADGIAQFLLAEPALVDIEVGGSGVDRQLEPTGTGRKVSTGCHRFYSDGLTHQGQQALPEPAGFYK